MKPKLTLALVALITGSAFAAIPKVLPEFKNEKQLAEWRAEMAAKHAATTTASDDRAFFTGKPYIESTGSYAFKYRNYNPELARWTSEDPSGFPDGANGNMYAPNPMSQLDYMGLWRIVLVSGSSDYGNPVDYTATGRIEQNAYQTVSSTSFSISNTVQVGSFAGTATAYISGSAVLSPGGNEIMLSWDAGKPTSTDWFATSTVAATNITLSDNNRTVSFRLDYGGASAFGGLSVGSLGISATGSANSYNFSTITYTLVE